MDSVERVVELPVNPNEAWESVTDLGEWFGTEVDGALELGEVIRIGHRRAIVERADEPSRLTFRFIGEDASRVDIALEPGPDGTTMRVTERRIESAVTPRQEIGFKALAPV